MSKQFEAAKPWVVKARRHAHRGESMDGLLCLCNALDALGEQPDPDNGESFTEAVMGRYRLKSELAEVRRQHQQTIEERDKLAKRVAELERAGRMLIDLKHHDKGEPCCSRCVRYSWASLQFPQSSSLAGEAK